VDNLAMSLVQLADLGLDPITNPNPNRNPIKMDPRQWRRSAVKYGGQVRSSHQTVSDASKN